MVSTVKDPVLAVISLSGGNDGMNTVIPYNNPHYRDYRPALGVPEDQIIPITDQLGFHPAMAPLKKYWDEGKLAIIQGIGYPNGSLSHFRSMDIWATCEPEELGLTGWLGSVIQDVDPKGENVLTGVNFGRGLPRSLAKEGVPVASVGDLGTYGLLTEIGAEAQRAEALDLFGRMYAPAIGQGVVDDYIRRTGIEALKGADILKTVPGQYQSSVEYADSLIGRNLQGISKVLTANLGTRIFYTEQPGYDTHANQGPVHGVLLAHLSQAIRDFYDDLRQHNASENVLIYLFTEFGRRVKDNGSGTDHGAGGLALAIGDPVKGGIYSEFPSMHEEDLEEGDLKYNIDFRGVYGTVAEKWLGLDATSIVGGKFEQLDFV